jgi:hypothetical protein
MQQAASPGEPAARLLYAPLDGGEPTDLTGKAWVGRTVFVRRDPVQRGPAIEFGDRDYLIPVGELPAEPKLGDRLTERLGAWDVTFEVVTPAGEPAWRWSDPGRTVYRVHTKEVGRSEAP